MITDELARTAAYRPQLSVPDPDAVLARILQDAAPVRSGNRRTATVLALAAGVAVAAVLVPTVLPTSSPGSPPSAAAAELLRLSAAATSSGDDQLPPGQFRHQIVTEHQVRPEFSTTLESWTGSDGRVWRRDTTALPDGTPGRTETYLFTDPGSEAAALPTDPDDLQQYLVAHASGSTSTDEAVFSQLSDLLRGYGVPAALRSAATQVLARTGHVQLGARSTDRFGRTVQEVSFVDAVQRGTEVQSITFDTADARVTAERIAVGAASVYEATVAPADIAQQVPRDVLRDAVPYGTDEGPDPVQGG